METLGTVLGTPRAHLGQGACPKWESCMPHMGKHAAHLLQFYDPCQWLCLCCRQSKSNQRNVSHNLYCMQKSYQTVVRQAIHFHTIPSSYSPTIQTITRWFQRANKGGNTCISMTFASTTRWLTIFWKNEVIYQNRTGRQSRTSFKGSADFSGW